ncbi:hypothetical protein BEWA_045780 [Theileria equi strain WA]|uniref:Uncharacterized protein n=1 Tax=Theileria equi strain WA TaxID=1537102 RepID=L1LA37_THEEQ|nr:hypothetical protein BEWA_045780 [Theileria equi strain WA]EKX72114.1 hypothetical protein BEWA_045780 [Theileria equi strain WA]|eukprot:XP_004831566.1 hypothetical protein BEWA_045780 [Theileria equi strain WA]
MDEEINLDIGPSRFNGNHHNDIKGVKRRDYPSEYICYEYEKATGVLFQLDQLYYGTQELDYIIPPTEKVSKIITYFTSTSNSLLVIQIKAEYRCYYYTNHNTDVEMNPDSIFDDFVTINQNELATEDLTTILKKVEEEKSLDYESLSNEMKTKLLRRGEIVFDLKQQPKGGKRGRYKSKLTGVEIWVENSEIKSGEYTKVRHRQLCHQFWIKGIKNPKGDDITLEAGFPNEPLEEFSVYYDSQDKSYANPLLIVLTVWAKYPGGSQEYGPGKYLLSKNRNCATWHIRRVSSALFNEEICIPKIIDNIELHNRLEVSKLKSSIHDKVKDVTRELSLDATQTSLQRGTYSNRSIIHYRKGPLVEGYNTVLHADTFPSFTVRSVKVNGATTIDYTRLPPFSVPFVKFCVYYTNSYKIPVLIEFICLNPVKSDARLCAYYYSRDYHDGVWVGYLLTTTADESEKDLINLLKHIKENRNRINHNTLGTHGLHRKLTRYEPYTEDIGETAVLVGGIVGIIGAVAITAWKLWPMVKKAF